MTTPAIQNDLSYYRRALSRQRLDDSPTSRGSHGSFMHTEDMSVTSELANCMSLFYAQATPMLRVLSDSTTRFVSEHKEVEVQQTTETLGTMAQVCQRMLETTGNLCHYCYTLHQMFSGLLQLFVIGFIGLTVKLIPIPNIGVLLQD